MFLAQLLPFPNPRDLSAGDLVDTLGEGVRLFATREAARAWVACQAQALGEEEDTPFVLLSECDGLLCFSDPEQPAEIGDDPEHFFWARIQEIALS